jgi:RNA-directed DNA polymerase
MNTNRLKRIEPNSTALTEDNTEKARTLESLSADQSAIEDKTPVAYSPSPVSLMELVVDQSNMLKAWSKVKANKGAPGPDGITLEAFSESFRHQWPKVRQALLDGTYQPSPARRKAIPKPDGSFRNLGIPNVVDRLIQQAILQVLTPIFDPEFSESSFGFRPNRSAHGAIKQVQRHIRSGYRHCVDMDLSKFFDRVDHAVLLARVSRKVSDLRLLRLISRYLRAGVMVDCQWEPSIEGTMQGGPLSPLLANVLLDDFDKELEKRGLRFVRFADDFLVFTKTEKAAQRVFASVERYLTRKLHLVVNHQKSRVCSAKGIEFLGYRFTGYSGHFDVSPKNIAKFKERVQEITRRNRGVSISSRYRALGWYLRGWCNYFSLVEIKTFYVNLDKWVRHRIRACYWKQWRKTGARARNLMNLGLSQKDAVLLASSSRGPWFMSKCRSVERALTNDYLAKSGLVSLYEIWQTTRS